MSTRTAAGSFGGLFWVFHRECKELTLPSVAHADTERPSENRLCGNAVQIVGSSATTSSPTFHLNPWVAGQHVLLRNPGVNVGRSRAAPVLPWWASCPAPWLSPPHIWTGWSLRDLPALVSEAHISQELTICTKKQLHSFKDCLSLHSPYGNYSRRFN